MKRIIALFLTVAALLTSLSTGGMYAAAEEPDVYLSEGIYTYLAKNGEAHITTVKYTAAGKITVPSTLGGLKVTKICDSTFANNENIQSVDIGANITYIGLGAFSGCVNLESVTITDCDTFGNSVFNGCTKLKSVKLPAALTAVPAEMFYGSTSLEEAVLPNNVSIIMQSAFYGCTALKSIYFPNKNSIIGKEAFKGCTALKSVNAAGAVSVYNGAFCECTQLESFPFENITIIDTYAFDGCKALKEVTVPAAVQRINDYAFRNCKSLKKVTVEYGVEEICPYAFYGSGVSELQLPDTLQKIGKYAFADCQMLKSFTVPDGLNTLSDFAFHISRSIESFEVNNNPNFSVDAYGALYNADKTKLYKYPIGSAVTVYKLPGTVSQISNAALSSCANLKAIVADSDWFWNDERGALFTKYITATDYSDEVTPKLVQYPVGNKCATYQLPKYTLPNTNIKNVVDHIGSWAFFEANNLRYLFVGNATVEPYAIYNCANMWHIVGEKTRFSSNNSRLTHEEYFSCVQEITESELSCTNDGVYHLHCSVCNQNSADYTVKAAHTYDDDCDAVCNACDYKRNSNHILKVTDVVACGSCTDGYTGDIKCILCGTVTDYGKVIKAAHNYKLVGKKAATCTAAGYTGDTKCTVCGTVTAKGKTIAATGHKTKTVVTKATTKANGKAVTTCTVCKKVTKTVTINKIASVKLSATKYIYSGKAKTPSVVVKDSKGKTLKKGTDYTVTYASGRKNVGKYTVKVTFKGNYSGSKSLSFTIVPKSTKLDKVTAGSKKLTVKWNKQATQTSGYQVQYSTSKSFKSAKTVTVSGAKKTSKTIKSLKAKKTYYVRVRTYKTVGKTKYYSAWSGAENAKTKK